MKIVILECFGTFLRSYVEITKAGTITEDKQRSTDHFHNRSTEHQRYRSMASHPGEQHLRKSQVLPKTPSYCTISSWFAC